MRSFPLPFLLIPLLGLLLIPDARACSASLHFLPEKDAYEPRETITIVLDSPSLFQVELNVAGTSYLLDKKLMTKKPIQFKAPDATTSITTKVLFGDCSFTAPKTLHIAPFYKPNTQGIPDRVSIPKLPLLMTLLSSLLAVVLVWRR